MVTEFTMTEEHVKLLRRLRVEWGDGAPVVDAKRPYGNKSLLSDIARIIGIEPTNKDAMRDNGDLPHFSASDRSRMTQLHREMEYAIQVSLATGASAPGTYRISKPYDTTSWVRVGAPEQPE